MFVELFSSHQYYNHEQGLLSLAGPNAKINCLFSHRHIFGLFLVFQSLFQLHFSLPTFIPRHLRFACWVSVCNWHSLNTNYYGTTFGGVPGSFNSEWHWASILGIYCIPPKQLLPVWLVFFSLECLLGLCRPTNSKTEGGADGDGSTTASSGAGNSEASQAQQQHQQFLGDTSLALPSFGSVDTSAVPMPDHVTIQDLHVFEKLYKEHAEVGL